MSIILNTLSDPKLTSLLQAGSTGVLPTDTVYGLACSALLPDAVSVLYSLKQRTDKPGTVIAADVEQLVSLGLKRRYLKPVEQYWPGQVSVVIPCHELGYIHLGVGSIAVRVVSDPELVALLQRTGPLLTTSANAAGLAPARNLNEAQQYFCDKVDFYVDNGNRDNAPSTIIQVIDDTVVVLRQGAVPINEQGEQI